MLGAILLVSAPATAIQVRPNEPGCFLRRPAGCPKRPDLDGPGWRRAVEAESFGTAGVNRTACEVDAKAAMVAVCGTAEVEALFVSPAGQVEEQLPAEPGCFVRKLKGCPNHPAFNSSSWRHAEQAEKFRGAKENKTACELVARANVQQYCGTADVEVLFVPQPEQIRGEADVVNGTSNGQGVGGEVDTGTEKPESSGQQSLRTEGAEGASVAEAEKPREFADPAAEPMPSNGDDGELPPVEPSPPSPQVDGADGDNALERAQNVAVDVEKPAIEQVPSAEPPTELSSGRALPTEIGCFVRTPTGCPNHPSFDSAEWKREEDSASLRLNKTMCEVERREQISHWCGAEDVEMAFVPASEPGCYVRTPFGCPNHPSFSSTTWKHEAYGENNTAAKVNRTVCEVDRKVHVAHWCGAADVEALFVPAAELAQS